MTNEIQVIQSKVDIERASLEALNQKISDAGLKEQIRLAMSSLEDVEQFFLHNAGQSIRNQISEDELMMARASLEIATQLREKLEKLLKNHFSKNKES